MSNSKTKKSENQKLKAVYYFSKTLHLRCLVGLWISLWCHQSLVGKYLFKIKSNPANNYLFKVNNRNTGKMYEICSKLTIKILERRQWRRLLTWSSLRSLWCFYCWLWTYFTYFSSFSIIDFDQASFSWERTKTTPMGAVLVPLMLILNKHFQIQENMDQKKLRIWTLFTQWSICW